MTVETTITTDDMPWSHAQRKLHGRRTTCQMKIQNDTEPMSSPSNHAPTPAGRNNNLRDGQNEIAGSLCSTHPPQRVATEGSAERNMKPNPTQHNPPGGTMGRTCCSGCKVFSIVVDRAVALAALSVLLWMSLLDVCIQ
ncbi:hypothetical protein BS47DRAFT_1363026 [Hydnum rufescens UP504]|uniref:Transmembrane protein n=1 Tax=Hydnum rufescens UP504 TaxID=1448309 RepID=A0A9P6AVD6_9AGAM|nr:hypothetical protein BS47DRAFT_1363026 [Hydnum rufescens UP504]